ISSAIGALVATTGREGEGERAVCGRGTTRRVNAEIIERAGVRAPTREVRALGHSSDAAATNDARTPAWYSHRLFRAAPPTLQASRLQARGPGRRLLTRGSHTKDSQMYAVIKTGGKQYRGAAGEPIKVERLSADIGKHHT